MGMAGGVVGLRRQGPNDSKLGRWAIITTRHTLSGNKRAPGLVDEDVGVRGEPCDDGGDVAVDLVDLVGGLGRGQQLGGRLPLGCKFG